MSTTTTATKKKAPPPAAPGKDMYLRWFKDMILMRRFEEKAGQLYTMQKFGGFCHLYIGQEAVLAGMVTAIRPTDRIITGYRDHAHPLVLGEEPGRVMAELYARSTGTSKGKGGSMHYFDKARNLFVGHRVVPCGQAPLGGNNLASSAATGSWAGRSVWVPASPLPTSTAVRTMRRSACSAMAPRGRASCTRPSTWR